MKIIICGHRDFTNWKAFCHGMNELKTRCIIPTTVVHGGAIGADSLAGLWARNHKIPELVHEAEWDKYKKAAGPIRNQKMADDGADYCIAFMDMERYKKKKSGTYDMITRAAKKQIMTWVLIYQGNEITHFVYHNASVASDTQQDLPL